MVEYWIDGNGKEHYIKDMDTVYIKRCMKEIKKACTSFKVPLDANAIIIHVKKDEHDDYVLHHGWCVKYARKYLIAFSEELKRRKKAKN